MTIKEREEELNGIIDEIQIQITKLQMVNIKPTHIICDVNGYADLCDCMEFMANGFVSLSGSRIAVKEINLYGQLLTVIQRIESKFKNINVYGKLK